MDSSTRTIEDRAITITEQLSCSPPEGDDWEFVSMSSLGGEFTIEAVAFGGEPRFFRMTLGADRGRLTTSVVCCRHVEEIVERVLTGEGAGQKRASLKTTFRSRAEQQGAGC